jgi:hypothetical protein
MFITLAEYVPNLTHLYLTGDFPSDISLFSIASYIEFNVFLQHLEIKLYTDFDESCSTFRYSLALDLDISEFPIRKVQLCDLFGGEVDPNADLVSFLSTVHNIHDLTLSRLTHNLSPQVISTANLCSPNIRNLEINSCERMNGPNLIHFVGYFTHLQTLNITGAISLNGRDFEDIFCVIPDLALTTLTFVSCNVISTDVLLSILRNNPLISTLYIQDCDCVNEWEIRSNMMGEMRDLDFIFESCN